jgi:hypothetical protein
MTNDEGEYQQALSVPHIIWIRTKCFTICPLRKQDYWILAVVVSKPFMWPWPRVDSLMSFKLFVPNHDPAVQHKPGLIMIISNALNPLKQFVQLKMGWATLSSAARMGDIQGRKLLAMHNMQKLRYLDRKMFQHRHTTQEIGSSQQ